MSWAEQDESAIEAEVRRLLQEANPDAAAAIAELAIEAPLLGVVDSRCLLEMVERLEQVFGIRVEPAQFTPENFESLGRVVDFVSRQVRRLELGEL